MEESMKYFVPEISDIRVGYECECLWCCQEPRPWWPILVTQDDNMNTKSLPIEEIYWRIQSNEIRTPYLTKEQIEAEGFKFDKDNYGVLEFSKWETEIHLRPADEFGYHWLNIFKTGTKPPTELYYGKCPSINEFRMICKLLGV